MNVVSNQSNGNQPVMEKLIMEERIRSISVVQKSQSIITLTVHRSFAG